jgi:hypothetical protein
VCGSELTGESGLRLVSLGGRNPRIRLSQGISSAAEKKGGQMKRGLLICLVGLAVLLLPTLASGAKSGWSDQGSGTPAGTAQNWQWSAKSDVNGGNASGHFSVSDAETHTYFSGDVTCLYVVSGSGQHTARIAVLITDSTNLTRPRGTWSFFTMQTFDGNFQNPHVGAGGTMNVGPPPTTCPITPSGFTSPFDGNITIRP